MIYALIGSESLLVRRALDKLLAEKVPAATREFNFDRFDGKGLEVKKVMEVAGTLPMMAPNRVVLIQDAQELKKGSLEELGDYLPHLPKTTDLIFVADGMDRRLSFWKNFEKIGKVMDLKPPYPRELPQWVIQEAREAGYLIAPEAAVWIVTAVGTDLTQIISSLEKIYLLKGKDRSITLQDAESCITALSWRSIFDLAESVGGRNLKNALHLYRRMSLSGESPIALVAILARHFRILLKVQEGDTSGIPPFFLKDYQRQGSQFGREELKSKMDKIFSTDWALKSSGQDPDLPFERLLMELCR